jgi:hypothetical protein
MEHIVSDKMFLVLRLFFLLQSSHCQDFADDIKNIFFELQLYAVLKNLFVSIYSALLLGSYELKSV